MAANPAVGGIPANITIAEIIDHWLIFEDRSFVFSVTFEFMNIFTTINKDTQYKTINETMDFELIIVASIIHLRLKTEERAITSIMVFAFICENLPTIALSKIITIIMGLSINVIK